MPGSERARNVREGSFRDRDTYTKINISEVKDSAAAHGLMTQEARFPREDLGAVQTGMNYLTVKAGQREAFAHKHLKTEEICFVVEGIGRIRLDHEIIDLAPHDLVRIGAGVTRQLEAGAANLTVLIFGPRVEGDTEVIKDFWNTAETSKSTAPKPREGGGR